MLLKLFQRKEEQKPHPTKDIGSEVKQPGFTCGHPYQMKLIENRDERVGRVIALRLSPMPDSDSLNPAFMCDSKQNKFV